MLGGAVGMAAGAGAVGVVGLALGAPVLLAQFAVAVGGLHGARQGFVSGRAEMRSMQEAARRRMLQYTLAFVDGTYRTFKKEVGPETTYGDLLQEPLRFARAVGVCRRVDGEASFVMEGRDGAVYERGARLAADAFRAQLMVVVACEA